MQLFTTVPFKDKNPKISSGKHHAHIHISVTATWLIPKNKSAVFFLFMLCLPPLSQYLLHKDNIFFTLFYLRRRTSLTWRRSCQRKAPRRVVTISQTPKAQKTTAGPSLQRAGGGAGCAEVLCTAYIRQVAVTHVD